MIIPFSELGEVRRQHADETIALAGGVFDIVHVGHVDFLEYVKSLADISVIAVSSDARVRERKGLHRPINNELARVALIDGIKYVDYSLIAPSPVKPEDGLPIPTVQIVDALRPNYFVTSEKRWLDYEANITNCGAQLIIDETAKRSSTTQIIQSILDTYTPYSANRS